MVSYGYHVNADSTKTALLESYQNSADTPYSYAYDANGNITEITKGTASASYVYDKANQLIRENDGLYANRTWTYSYDKHGNMLEKAEYAYTTGALGTPVQTISYTYSTGEWRDLLTGYNGQAITYDAMGNPTSYLGSALSWTDGRKLESFGSIASYVYSREGTRIQKTVGNTVTNYHYNGSLLMAETTGNTSQYYSYDANGNLISLYYNNAYYYCLRNGQGDIVGLIDGTGTPVVAYTYDAWGKALSVTGTLASTLGIANPFRYRGYYYDTETGLYYLQSRYYDPVTCRFLNRDVLISTGQGVVGHNMFAYCRNNPVDNFDSAGCFNISNIFKMAIKVSLMMLETALTGNGSFQEYGERDAMSKTLSNSTVMKEEVKKNIEAVKASGQQTATVTGTISLYGKDSKYDFDLSYAVGAAHYSMLIEKETRSAGIFGKRTKSRYVVTVTVTDTYDFTEYRNDQSLGSILNNWGYNMQNKGKLTPFDWKATYTVKGKWTK